MEISITTKRMIMKKIYRKPEIAAVDMTMESLIAASLDIDASKSGNQQLSNKFSGGWNSDDWSDLGDEDAE